MVPLGGPWQGVSGDPHLGDKTASRPTPNALDDPNRATFTVGRRRGGIAGMSSIDPRPPRDLSFRDLNPASLYAIGVAFPVIAAILIRTARSPQDFEYKMIAWVLFVAIAELLPVPAWRGIHVSLGFTLLTAVAILYSPFWAAAIALLGSTDLAEIRRETTLLKALFNRSQVALAVLLASATFHALANIHTDPVLVVIACNPRGVVRRLRDESEPRHCGDEPYVPDLDSQPGAATPSPE